MTKIKKTEQLLNAGHITKDQIEKLQEVSKKFSVSITETIDELIDNGDINDPIARQFVPSENELDIKPEELSDPIGDQSHSPVKGIVHRYPDRCLLIPMTVCPVYCRFCFRREKVGSPQSGLKKHELDAALQYIKDTPEIWEVILSGGDPLFMSPKTLKSIIERLSEIDHVTVIRIHTRVPVVDPARIDTLLDALKTDKALFIALHANHQKEFSALAKEAIAKLVNAGVPMLGQSVLLKGVNDTPEALENLLREFVKNRVKPYYLHHGDIAKGTSHFRTTLEEGRNLMKQIRGRVSGLCQPNYTLDIPGGAGKVPVNSDYIVKKKDYYIVTGPQGQSHQYNDA
jgi:lysine 2,3-aminomutase